MEKILISTKFGFNNSSDAVGGSVFQVLLAEYICKNFNYEVFLHDPFYNSSNCLEKFCNVSDNLQIRDLNLFDRIVDPLFYVAKGYDYKKKKILIFMESGLIVLAILF